VSSKAASEEWDLGPIRGGLTQTPPSAGGALGVRECRSPTSHAQAVESAGTYALKGALSKCIHDKY